MATQLVLFAPPRQDPCLLPAFVKAKKSNKSLVDSSLAVTASCGAAAHAICAATETVEHVVAEMEKAGASQEGGWKDFFLNTASALKQDALLPLNDAMRLQAASYGRSVAAVRNGVIAAAEAPVKEVLGVLPPKDGFFFGDPVERVSSSMGYALMSAQLHQASSSRGGRGGTAPSFSRKSAAKATAASAAKKTSTPAAAASSSSTRPFSKRGGGKGRK